MGKMYMQVYDMWLFPLSLYFMIFHDRSIHTLDDDWDRVSIDPF